MKKRILSALLAVLLILSVVPVNLAFALAIGDVNGDGTIAAADARLALRASVGLETLTDEQKAAADVDGNPGITAADARLILRASVGLEQLHTHAYTEKVTTAATCTEKGVKTFTCACGDSYTEEIPAKGHTEVKDAAISATCTTAGKTEGSHCSVCNTVLNAQKDVPVAAHKEVEIPAVAATCEKEGKTAGKKCEVCGKVTQAPVATAKKAHTEVIIPAVAATCKDAGKTAGKKCKVCGTEIQKQTTIPATGIHVSSSLDESTVIQVTCSQDGYTGDKKCDICGTVTEKGSVVKSQKTEHKLVNTTIPVSCTQSGYTVNKCEYCDYFDETTYVEGEPATGHSMGEKTIVKPTCTEQGYSLVVCTKCQAQEKSEYVDATGHSYKWTTTKPATCKETGTRKGECETCGFTTTEVLGLVACKPASKAVTVKGSKDTNTYCKSVLKCTVCDGIIWEKENTGHNIVFDGIVLATCTTPRTGNKYCRDCNYNELGCILNDPNGHKLTPSDRLQPTCTEPGYIEYSGTCTECNENVENEKIILKAKGHTLKGVQTCTTSVTCTTCKEVIEPALGHDYTVYSAAYKTDVSTFFCNRCGAVASDSDVLTSFNGVVNKIPSVEFISNKEYCPTLENSSFNLQRLAKSHISTTYSRFDFGIYTSAIKSLYEDEMANTPDEYEPVRSRYINNELKLPPDKKYVSLLTMSDIDSVKAEKLANISIADVLSAYDTTYTVGTREYNIQKFKDVNVTDVIKVTVDIKNEKYSQVKNMPDSELTSLQKICDVNIREQDNEYDDNLEMKQVEEGEGYSISMTMKLREISTDAKVTYYFKADTLEPIIALYDTDLVMDQTIDMNFKIGLFSLNGELDPIISTNVSRAYLFSHFFEKY